MEKENNKNIVYDEKDKILNVKHKIRETMKPIEANVVGCLWKNPNLYFDYPELDKNTFKNPIWIFYFTIGKKIAHKGIKVLDDVAVETYLLESEQAYKKYREYDGYKTIEDLEMYITEDNIESYISELQKWSALYNIVETFDINSNNVHEFSDLNINELYDYFNVKLNHLFINVDDGVESHQLEDDLDEIIEEADKGLNVGMPIPSPILNNEIGGVINGQIILWGGLSGTGKTSATIQLLLSSVFENGEPAVIMINEQDHKLWKKELITWIINNKFSPSTLFNKKRWRQGSFTQEEKELLYSAKKYLEEKMQNNKITLIHFKSYSRKQAEKVIKKYAALGVKKFVLDTFKISSDRDNSESFWLSMQEDMRKFDDLVKPSNLDVNLWVTLQLQKGSVLKRYLTGDSIGMAKNVIDVASVGLLMRRVRNDEYEGGKFELKVWQPVGGSMASGKEVKLDPRKKYVIIFIEKNRNGESQTYQIVAEQDLGHLIYREVGICDIPFDS